MLFFFVNFCHNGREKNNGRFKVKRKILTGFAGIATAMILSTSVQAGELDGVWRTESGWHVKLYKCGSAYCGRVVGGTTMKDVHNPKASLRSRKVVGIRMIWGMKKHGSKYTGKLYNPKDGKTYSGKVNVLSKSAIKLSGCVFGGLICKGQTWKRIR